MAGSVRGERTREIGQEKKPMGAAMKTKKRKRATGWNNTVLVPRSVLSTFGDEYEGPDSKSLRYQSFTGPAATCFTRPAQAPAARFLLVTYMD
ncbi:hypothetical protein MRX96_057264 [Rhipicephalus microplus]